MAGDAAIQQWCGRHRQAGADRRPSRRADEQQQCAGAKREPVFSVASEVDRSSRASASIGNAERACCVPAQNVRHHICLRPLRAFLKNSLAMSASKDDRKSGANG